MSTPKRNITKKKTSDQSILCKIAFSAYDPNKKAHLFCALLSVLLCTVIALTFCSLLGDAFDDVAYPFEQPVKAYNPYMQQFDAFMKGQLDIDVKPDPRLLTLDNPYDYWKRDEAGLKGYTHFLWDRAFYDGKYYSYFGIAPIITVYFPYYLIKGSLPGDSFTMEVFALTVALFLPLALFKWAEAVRSKIPLWLIMLAAPTLLFNSAALLLFRGVTHFYYLAVLAGTAFLSMFFFLALAAFTAEKSIVKYVLYLLAGISYSLVLLSRINIALLAAFLVLPGLWFFVIKCERPPIGSKNVGKRNALFAWLSRNRRQISELISIGAPVALTGVFLLWFNSARFSGPLDFGTNYQLTIADVSTYKLRISDLPFALYNYFLAPAEPIDTFPYVIFSYRYVLPGHYVYSDANLGLFCLPATLGLLASPAVVFSGSQPKRRRAFILFSLAGVIAVAWLNFCKGGIIYRYTADLAATASLIGIISLFSLYDNFADKLKTPAKAAFCIAIALFLLISVYFALQISLINGNGNISKISTETIEQLSKYLRFFKHSK